MWWLTQFRRWGMTEGEPDYDALAKKVGLYNDYAKADVAMVPRERQLHDVQVGAGRRQMTGHVPGGAAEGLHDVLLGGVASPDDYGPPAEQPSGDVVHRHRERRKARSRK